MVRRLKVFQTSLGFYDLAIAAPSMKAALEAWGAGAGRNLFHDGVAKESSDPKVVAAAMSEPGVVLRRPVGSTKPFTKHADLPTNLGGGQPGDKQEKPRAKASKARRGTGDRADRKAALAFERERERQERERRKEASAKAKLRERRGQAIAKAKAALERGEREHEKRAALIEEERAAIEKQSQAEEDRWVRQKEKLDRALRRVHEA